jgi:superfamily I DNA/RNA helicase
MNWSKEQIAIFEFFREGTGHAIVKARAGTGKTTTIKEAFVYAPEDRILYAVFNKKNQIEAQLKIVDRRVEVKTLHSLGFSYIKSVWHSAKPDDSVEVDRLERVCPAIAQNYEARGNVLKLVAFAKNTTSNTTSADMERLADQLNLQFGDIDGCAVAMAVLAESKKPDSQNRISFNDMVWLPVVMSWVSPRYDLVCVDEAQDMTLPQLTMARQACKKPGRIVVVGDDRQAIYGFRGAVQNGMGMMKMILRAKEFSLTTTYRCPRMVVEMAAKYVPDYKAAPEAPKGHIEDITPGTIEKIVKPLDAILSRMNAPLMPIALRLLRLQIPARIEGKDIGRQLIATIRSLSKYPDATTPALIKLLEIWKCKQCMRLEGTKNADKKIEQILDVAQTIEALAEDCDTVAEVTANIESLFEDSATNSNPAVVLSSVHKAKGLEWERVFLLEETFRASKGGEEENIYYVALTRTKSHLYLVGGVDPKEENEKDDTNSIPQITTDYSSYDVLPGSIRRQVGDIILFGRREYTVDRVSASRATAKAGKETISINTVCDPGDVIRRIDLTLNQQPVTASAD